MKLTLLNRISLHGIPSASGIEKVGELLYVVGDNSHLLFELDLNFKQLATYPISSDKHIENGIIPKKKKNDWEAMCMVEHKGEKRLYVFGSGSKAPKRDKLVKITLGNTVESKKYSLEKLYEELRKNPKIGEELLNIEAADVCGDYLYLFNRETNTIIRYLFSEFRNYLKHEDELPKPEYFTCELPDIGGMQAGFSGACSTPDGKHILFTASVENRNNTIDDGEILGSFVGIINTGNISTKPACVQLVHDGKPLTLKVESLVLKSHTKNSYTLYAVTDSDGSDSELLELQISTE